MRERAEKLEEERENLISLLEIYISQYHNKMASSLEMKKKKKKKNPSPSSGKEVRMYTMKVKEAFPTWTTGYSTSSTSSNSTF